jgi:putative flippase GtrA
MFTFTKVLEKRFPRLLGRDRVTGQALRFVVVGGVNTVVDMGIFYLLGLVPGMSLVMAKAISYNLGTVNSFALNKYLTFNTGRSRKGWREFGVFFAINVPPMIIDVVVFAALGLWSNSGTFGERMTKAFLAAVVTAAWTFVASRYLAFGRPAAEDGSRAA